MKYRSIKAWRFALSGVAVACTALLASQAWALGLGRLNVQSALGEQLRADIDVTSITAEEAASLRLRLMGPEAYRAAGVEYNTALVGAQVQQVRRPDGRTVLRVTTDRAVVEPFLELIVEATWASGRVVREYTVLLDPPANRPAPAPAAAITSPLLSSPATAPSAPAAVPSPVAPAPVAPSSNFPAPAPASTPFGTPPAAAPAPTPTAPPSPSVVPEPAVPTAQSRPAANRTAAAPAPIITERASPDEYRVKAGDTLSRVAGRLTPAGVSLDQMLVALFRANPDAFVGDNMNRLKRGAVLNVPTADAVSKVTAQQAREVIVAQSADFSSYRQRLAAGTTTVARAGASRQASGKVQARVEDRRAEVASPDKLRLSQGRAATGGKPAVETTASREAERKESGTRLSELSRNVEELRRLQGGGAAGAKPSASAPAMVAQAPATPAMPGTLNTPPGIKPAGAAAAPAAAPVAPPPLVTAATSKPSTSPAPAPALVPPPVLTPPPTLAQAPTPSSPSPSPVVAASPAPAPAPVPVVPVPQPAPKPVVTAAAPKPVATPPAVKTESPSMVQAVLDNPMTLPAGGAMALGLAGFGLWRLRQRNRKSANETSFLESRLQPDSFFGASGGQRIDTRESGTSANSGSSSMSYSLSQLDAIGDVDPVAEADVYLAYGRDLQAEEILKEAMRSNPERMAIRSKLLEVYAKRRDVKGFELLAQQMHNLTRGEGEDWIKAQELGLSIDPENPMYRPGGSPSEVLGAAGQPVEPLNASTMPYVPPVPAPSFQPAHGMASLEAGAHDGLPDLDLDLDLGQGRDSQPGRLAGSSAAQFGEQKGSHFSLDTVDPQATQVMSSARGGPGGSLDFDVSGFPGHDPAMSPAGRPSGFAPAMGDGDPLGRKLELAEEFRQIGDLEGARDLLEEVLAKAEGPLRNRAQTMLNSLA